MISGDWWLGGLGCGGGDSVLCSEGRFGHHVNASRVRGSRGRLAIVMAVAVCQRFHVAGPCTA